MDDWEGGRGRRPAARLKMARSELTKVAVRPKNVSKHIVVP